VKKYLFLLAPLFFCIGCNSVEMPMKQVTVGEQEFLCEIAKTPKERAQGLMFREDLEQNTGMLFDLGKEEQTGFWMKNTLIPLDIIWIGTGKTVSDVQTAQPCTDEPCEIFKIEKPIRWVLEVNAGEFKGKVGDKVEFESEF
jgi:hypothetical protein